MDAGAREPEPEKVLGNPKSSPMRGDDSGEGGYVLEHVATQRAFLVESNGK